MRNLFKSTWGSDDAYFSNADPSDAVYHDFRQGTRKGLMLGSVGTGVVKIGLSVYQALYGGISSLLPNANLIKNFVNEGVNGPACSSINALKLRNRLAAQEIAGGHAFEKHILTQGEFKWIRTRRQFAEHIEDVLNNPSAVKVLKNNRTAYWHPETGTVVIRNPGALDGGTAFQPIQGNDYFIKGLR